MQVPEHTATNLPLAGLALLLSAFYAPRAGAQTEVGLTGGTEYGFGAIATTGSRAVQFEAGVGLAPVIFVATVIGGESIFKVYFPVAVGAKVSFAINKPGDGNRRAIKVGATYNSLLKVGVGGGLDFRMSDRLKVSGGVMIYPKAKERLIQQVNKDDGSNYDVDAFSAPLANVQPFVGFALFFR